MFNKNRLHLVLALALVFALVAPALNTAVRAADEKVLTYNAGVGDIPSADPALAQDTASHQVVTLTHYALVRDLEDKPGNIQPALAEKWSISDDGKTYTFTIRKDIPWVKWDGSAVVEAKDSAGKTLYVTAQDFEYGIKRMLDPRTASPYAYVYVDSLGIVGSSEFNGYKVAEGKKLTDPDVAKELDALKDKVAVKAKDATTLEVQIKDKLGYAIFIFGLWSLAATPQSAIEQFGDKWTEPGNSLSYGPYVVSEWKHDESMTMVKNPFWPGLPNAPKPTIDKIVGLMVDETPAFNNYEAGTLDVVNVPLSEIDRVRADAVLSKEFTVGPSFGTYYYGFNQKKAPFDDARVRRAFSMAIDRQAIIDNVTKGGQEPARWFARPGLVAAPTMKDSPELGIGYDVAGAKAELDAYLKEKGITIDKLPPITLMVNQVEGHVKIAEAIQQMWKDNLGVAVTLATQEWKVYLQTLASDAPQVYRLGWNYDYPDTNNFDRDVFRSTSSQNYTKWTNVEYDKLVDQAALETDVAKRLDLYRQAETILVKTDAAIAPIYWYTRVEVTKPYITRTYEVGSGDARYEKWDIKK
jgi:oligopeptide transport system substrate-binding protein